MKKHLTIVIEYQSKDKLPFNQLNQCVFNSSLDPFRIVALADRNLLSEIEKLENKLEGKE